MILVAASIGFILGSRSGRKPYEALQRQVSKLRPNGENAGSLAAEDALRARVESPQRSTGESWPAHAAV